MTIYFFYNSPREKSQGANLDDRAWASKQSCLHTHTHINLDSVL